ncbi:FAD-binding oxidoreductase [uncultured Gammaproteobacteria bacterium]
MTREQALDMIRAVVGAKGWLDRAEEMAPYLTEYRGRFRGAAAAVVRPATTTEVAEVVRLCAEAQIPIVPQSGNTSLVGGSIPFETGSDLVLSLSRLNRIRNIDPLNYTMTVEAGCILKTVQDAAEEADRLFPLSFGAEGSCQIGGCLSSNAGGMLTLRYGNTRDLILGLEVVLPDGRVWEGLRRLRKDNTGYDLKHLFIGAEGTLGVVTAAVLKLFPRPKQTASAFVAVPDPAAAVGLLSHLRATLGDVVSAFELIPRRGLDFALRHVPGTVDPLQDQHGWYVLIEAGAGTHAGDLGAGIEDSLGAAIEAGLVTDGTIAASVKEAQAYRFIREAIVEAQKFEGGSIKHDVSVPVSRVAEFISRATAEVERLVPGIRPVPFGHVGDGNIHFNLNQPEAAETAAFMARWDEIQTAVHDIVLALEGSISAEHGIGRIKRDELVRTKGAVELELMKRIKRAFDPESLMNPDKVLVP